MKQWIKNFFAGMNFHTILHALTIIVVVWVAYNLLDLLDGKKKIEKLQTENAEIKKQAAAIELQNSRSKIAFDSTEAIRNKRIDSLSSKLIYSISKMQVIDTKINRLGEVFKNNKVDLPDPDK